MTTFINFFTNLQQQQNQGQQQQNWTIPNASVLRQSDQILVIFVSKFCRICIESGGKISINLVTPFPGTTVRQLRRP